MKRLYSLAISSAALLAAGSAAAQKSPEPPPMARGPVGFSLLQFDTNNDGKVTRAEVSTVQKAHVCRG